VFPRANRPIVRETFQRRTRCKPECRRCQFRDSSPRFPQTSNHSQESQESTKPRFDVHEYKVCPHRRAGQR
jgi:hypothetical protein